MNRTRRLGALISPAVAAFMFAAFCAGAAEQERRANEQYFNDTVVPGIDLLQENALAAVRDADPERLGNALLMLILARDELAAAIALPALTEERRAFLGNIAAALGLATEDESRRFRDFLAWSKKQSAETPDWIPETRAALVRFERHIVDADPLGAWLPAWVATIPLLPAASFDSGAVPPAWTWRGHAVANELVAAATADARWRAGVLSEYRKNALASWRAEAATLWEGVPTTIPDADIPALLRRAGEGDDPASRFAKLAAEHLLPMFDGEDEPPEIAWLRHRLQLEVPEESASVDEAARRAVDRTASLNTAAGANVWPTLSPLAANVYVRRLLARQAALELDATWRRSVYTPSRFSPGNAAEQRGRLVAFLTGPADGFWAWRENAGGGSDVSTIGNARWHGVPMTLSREFLAYCNAVLTAARNPALEEIPFAFAVDSINIAGKNVIERPTEARFRLGAGENAQTVTYSNYPARADWTWTPAVEEAEIRIDFPSRTATMRFTTPAELKRFYTLFGEGRCILAPEDFGPDAAPSLRRLGVEEIIIAATLSNLEKLLPQLNRAALPPLPMSIITKRGK